MAVSITASDVLRGGTQDSYRINYNPTECPLCHRGLEVDPVTATRYEEDKIEVVYRCPRRECGRYFIGQYFKAPESIYVLVHLVPVHHESREFDDRIEELSPAFCKIYNQASAAEDEGLDEIAGVGYRKAVEFLVKDYLIDKNPEEEDTIREKFLGSCINDHLEDEALRNCAKLAVWLGNDETHYTRRWVEKDISHLKELIELTMHAIAAAKRRAEYEAEMLGEEAKETSGDE